MARKYINNIGLVEKVLFVGWFHFYKYTHTSHTQELIHFPL
jgi:hypothetical protein